MAYPVTSARIDPSLIENLKDATGKDDVKEILTEALELLSDKYVHNSLLKLDELINLLTQAANAIKAKEEKGIAGKEDELIFEYYTKVYEMYQKVVKKIEKL
jgi:hypothetical protein